MPKSIYPAQFFLIQDKHVVLASKNLSSGGMLKRLQNCGWSVTFRAATAPTTLDLLNKGYAVAAILDQTAQAIIFNLP